MMQHLYDQRPASVQPEVQPSKSCSDFCEKDFTFVILNNVLNARSNFGNDNVSDRVTLQQHPSESLTLNCKIINTNNSSCNCDLTLNFENNLHEISQDYGYEIMLRALVEEKGKSYHLPLLSSREMRTEKAINCGAKEFHVSNKFRHLFPPRYNSFGSSSAIKLLHVCCGIRRFKISSINKADKADTELPFDELFRQHLLSDVCLKVGDREFQVHRAVLALRSSVFRAMFSHGETSESRTGLVKIDDIEAPVVEAMLRYLYTGCANEGISKFPMKLFKAAHKYDIPGLVAKCEEALMFEMSFANVIELLDLAKLYNLEILKRGAKAFIGKHEEDMVREPSYQEFLCRDLNLGTIVYTLKLCAKYHLPKVKAAAFEVVKRNAKKVSNDRKYLCLFETHPSLMKEIFVYINK